MKASLPWNTFWNSQHSSLQTLSFLLCGMSAVRFIIFYILPHPSIEYLWQIGSSASRIGFTHPLQFLTNLLETHRRTEAFLKLAVSLHTLGNVTHWQALFVVAVGRCWNWLFMYVVSEWTLVKHTVPSGSKTQNEKITLIFDGQPMWLMGVNGCSKVLIYLERGQSLTLGHGDEDSMTECVREAGADKVVWGCGSNCSYTCTFALFTSVLTDLIILTQTRT